MRNFLWQHKKKIFFSLLAAPALVSYGAGFYYFPELRTNQPQLFKALVRTGRIGFAGTRVAAIYLNKDPKPLEQKHHEASVILRDAFIKNAGLYLKFAQLLSSLDVVVPEEYRKTFEPLCHDCPENSFKNVKHSIESSLGVPLEETFSKFNEKPLKSASIAQVHEATLRSTGEKVAVKVQHDWLQESASGDLKVITLFVDIGEKIFSDFHFKWFADELNEVIPQELDFEREVRNSEKAKKMLSAKTGIYVPKNYLNFCNKKIITMEYIEGVPIMDVEELKRQKFDLTRVAKIISETFSFMIFDQGFVHADPHQGNLLIRKQLQKTTNKLVDQVVLLDHGLYKNLTPEFRLSYSKLWKGIIMQDLQLMKQGAKELNVPNEQATVFYSMIASRSYEDIMDKQKSTKDRLRSPWNQEERDKYSRSLAAKVNKIVEVLYLMNRNLLLVLKTTDFLRTIDNKLGSPINTFEITLNYCFREIEKYESPKTVGAKIKNRIDKLWLSIQFFFLKYFLLFSQGARS